jgi:hypothetical protein
MTQAYLLFYDELRSVALFRWNPADPEFGGYRYQTPILPWNKQLSRILSPVFTDTWLSY